VIAAAVVTSGFNGVKTVNFAAHPKYTFVNAADRLTRYIDGHPNGKRLLVSISGDEITLISHLPTLCDDFGTQDLASKLAAYRPGWYATWNDLDPVHWKTCTTEILWNRLRDFRLSTILTGTCWCFSSCILCPGDGCAIRTPRT